MAEPARPQAWPRRLSKKLAAEYMGVGEDTFDQRVKAGRYPQPIKEVGLRKTFWDREALDRFIDLQSGLEVPEGLKSF